ncbi:hypothetical protein A2Y99_04290 [Candidatus Gottesmanbacteria bacterium RBG_13_37_7]|uniref:DUF4340 domain-containing protein n=1 Tax=Candidatus Gottesmanbacteria bacterium RBG_13_37_7 TaxID=1798369 RepID=A0A1F5YH95_9BACT|nr:MAG: hypothetical protein A2Y99_04290 [Candidatus Gottesmanbacteria bacterium RBG_13_37_7]
MKPKSITLLFLVFIILLIAAAYPLWIVVIRPSNPKKIMEINLSIWTKDRTQKIIIHDATGEAVLSKDNPVWKTGNYLVGQKSLDNFFLSLDKSQIDHLVSRNSSNHGAFEVTEEKGTILTMTDSTGEKTYLIGKIAASYGSFYIRVKSSDNVYLAKGDLKNTLSTAVSFWRDKTIVDISKEKISQIQVSGKENFSLSKNKEGKWQLESKGKTNDITDNVSSDIITRFNPLEADGFLATDEAKQYQNNSGTTSIKISEENNNPVELTLLSKDSDYWIEVKGREEKYKIYSYRLDSLLKLTDEGK